MAGCRQELVVDLDAVYAQVVLLSWFVQRLLLCAGVP